jgi:hypothetical protein
LVVAILVAQRRRKARAAWRGNTERAVADGKLIIDQLRAGVAEQVDDEPALRRQVEVLASTLAGLETSAPSSDRGRVTDARQATESLAAALAADIQLRIGPPAPTTAQLETSQSVIDQGVFDLDAALDGLTQAAAPAT